MPASPLVIIAGLLIFWIAVSGRVTRVGDAWDVLRGKPRAFEDNDASGGGGGGGFFNPPSPADSASEKDWMDYIRRRQDQIERGEIPNLVDPATYQSAMIARSIQRNYHVPGTML